MDFTIYSIGDAVFLFEIINSVAMIAGSGSMSQIAMIGALLGVIIIMVQSLFQGAKQINFQHVLLGWVIYACLFGLTTRVLIEDVYDGSVIPVDNAPLGIGAAGHVISSVGYGISRLFEQGFGAIQASETSKRYMESLEILNELHRNGNDSAIFTAWNYAVGQGADLRASWNNYIRECTLTKIDMGESPLDEVMKQDIDTALKFDSNIFGTRLYLGGAPEELTCTEAWVKLQDATNRLKTDPGLIEEINKILGYDIKYTPNELSALDKAQVALDSIGLMQTDAFDFMKVSVLEPLYTEAAEGRHQDLRDYSSAIMLNQAIQQRNIQWASEQSMFMTVARPLMTFFEGFIYAVTPVLALLIMLGGFGLTLATKYMQSLLWIQLWMPTLTITNLYIHSAVSYQMVTKLGDGIKSMYALNTAADILANWIAVGGMLAASTPIISLFFVTGSTYAFTSLAQRIGGADHVDEKMLAPDISKSGAYVQGDPAFQYNQVHGMVATGADDLMTDTTFGNSLSSSINSATTNQSQKSEAFSQALSKAYSNVTSSQDMHSSMQSLGRSLGSTNNMSVESLESAVNSYMAENNIGSEHKEHLMGMTALRGSLEANLGKKKANEVMELIENQANAAAGLNVEGGTTRTSGDGTTYTTGDSAKILDSAGLSETQTASLTDAISSAFGDSSSQTSTYGVSEQDSEQLTKTSSELNSVNKTYSTLQGLEKNAGSNLNLNSRKAGGQIAASPEASAYMSEQFRYVAPEKAKDEAAKLTPRYRDFGMTEEQAHQAAMFTALTNSSHFTGGNAADGFGVAAKALSIATGNAIDSEGYNPHEHRKLAGNVDDSNVTEKVTGALEDVDRLDAADVREKAESKAGNKDAVKTHFQKNHDDTYNQAENANFRVGQAERAAAVNNLLSGGVFDQSKSSIMTEASQRLGTLAEWGAYAGVNLLKGDELKTVQDQDSFREKMRERAMSRFNLSPGQAAVFADSILPSGSQSAINLLRSEHAERDPETGNIIFDGNSPVLSPQSERIVNAMWGQIDKAANLGEAAGLPALNPVQRYNVTHANLAASPQEAARSSGVSTDWSKAPERYQTTEQKDQAQ